jgi:hypothetical protein
MMILRDMGYKLKERQPRALPLNPRSGPCSYGIGAAKFRRNAKRVVNFR